jgi:hypothetical protein
VKAVDDKIQSVASQLVQRMFTIAVIVALEAVEMVELEIRE